MDGEEAATNSDHNCLSLNLHENFFPSEPVNAWSFSLKVHFTSQAERCFVDVVRQVLVDGVVKFGFVNEKLAFNSALHVLNLE